MNSIDRFHAHLDICDQCKNQPFNLCKLGKLYLEVAAREGIVEILKEKERN